MKTTIIYAHPWPGSFNQHILNQLGNRYPQAKVIDLYQDGFDPVIRREELALYAKGEHLDPLVGRYQQLLADSNRLVFVFPIWWYGMPAILKGFFDKVMLTGFAYQKNQVGLLVGQLTHIKETLVITTSQAPTWYIRLCGGNPIGKTLSKRIFKDIGLKKVKWWNEGNIATSPKSKKAAFLKKLAKM